MGQTETLRALVEGVYRQYHRPELIHPDPLEYVRLYPEREDREVVGLIASSLAYGQVSQILRIVGAVLEPLGPRPARFLRDADPDLFPRLYGRFRYRFSTPAELTGLLTGVRQVLLAFGDLESCLLAGLAGDERQPGGVEEPPLRAGLTFLVAKLKEPGGSGRSSLLPAPSEGSACKRLHLYLRWMVRCDAVDPGGWSRVPASRLVVPLDVHMHRIGLALGLTQRRSADLRTAREITEGFAALCPEDPVRYDFSLTRLGIRDDCDPRYAPLVAARSSPNRLREIPAPEA